jgi:hypothetical protein
VKGEESKREKNRNEEPPALYSRDDSPAGLHSRAEERARLSFPAPARATRRRPEIAPVRRAQPSSGETNPSRVSPQPGCGVGFGRGWPGTTSGQGRKQVCLQPMGARPTSQTHPCIPWLAEVYHGRNPPEPYPDSMREACATHWPVEEDFNPTSTQIN